MTGLARRLYHAMSSHRKSGACCQRHKDVPTYSKGATSAAAKLAAKDPRQQKKKGSVSFPVLLRWSEGRTGIFGLKLGRLGRALR